MAGNYEFGPISGLFMGGLSLANDVYNAKKQRELEEAQLEYNAKLNRMIMDREDNYMQRRLADFTSAGYSPLAALENSAGNYSSTVSALNQDFSANQLLSSGFHQAANQISGSLTDLAELGVERSKVDEQKRTNQVLESIEYDKLDEQKKEFVDMLKSQEKRAEDALKNAKDIANISAEAQKEIARKNRAWNESIASEHEKNQMKMFEKQLSQAWTNAEKARSQGERKIWIDAVSKILAAAGAAAISGAMHNPTLMNFESEPQYQMGFHE